MSEPVDLSAKRQERLPYAVCTECPSAYFKVECVTLSPTLTAEGYSGIPVCMNCGTLRSGGFPEGVPMPCGGCGVPLTLPADDDHRCPTAPSLSDAAPEGGGTDG